MANIKENFNMIVFRRIMVYVAMVGLLAVWILAIQKTSNETISKVEINIAAVEGVRDLVIEKEIFEMMKESSSNDLLYSPISKLDIGEIEQGVLSDSRIHNAEIYVDAQKSLNAEIIQRRPILRVKDANGLDYYLDQSGNYVAKSQYRAVRVPVVTGYLEEYKPGWEKRNDSNIKKAFIIGQEIYKDNFLSALIEQIHFERSERIILIPKIGNERIVLQYMDDLNHKLGNLKYFYRDLAKSKNWGKYEELDISYKNQVIGRNSDKP